MDYLVNKFLLFYYIKRGGDNIGSKAGCVSSGMDSRVLGRGRSYALVIYSKTSTVLMDDLTLTCCFQRTSK